VQIRPLLFASTIVALVAVRGQAFATDLGNALSFGVLSIGGVVTFGTDSALSGGDVGGTGITLRRNASVDGDLIASPNGIKMKKGSSAINCITSGATVTQADGEGINCLSADTTDTNSEVTTLLPDAISDVAAFVTAAMGEPVTQAITDKIVVPANESQVITDTQAGLNIITVPSIKLKKDAVLTFQGFTDRTDQVVLIVAGNLKLGNDSDLAPSNFAPSFSEQNLVILVLGNSVTVGENAVLNGTVVAPNATCTLAADFATRGAYICGKHLTLSNENSQGSGSIAFSPATGVVLP
jgi:hypothetical protein